jgi:hypothetical protein
MFTIQLKTAQKNTRAEILQCSNKERYAFLPRSITSDGAWAHHYNMMMKR